MPRLVSADRPAALDARRRELCRNRTTHRDAVAVMV
jgi:hypothetical protein